MNEKKLSFKEILKGLYQYEWTWLSLKTCILAFFFNSLMIFLFILLPEFNIFGIDDIFTFLLSTFALSMIFLIPYRVSNKRHNRAVFLTKSIIEAILENLSALNLFENKIEKQILEKNLKSLYIFQKIHDYKYSMVVMGSIIEFILVRYCNKNNINPEDYTNPRGDIISAKKNHFCNYIQSAIKHDILGQKNSWYLVQNNLRNFRNYVHISKEMLEENIDYDWYISTKGVFDRIIRNLKSGK